MIRHPYRSALVFAVLGVVAAVALSRTPMSPVTDWVWIAGFAAAGTVLHRATRPSEAGSRSPTRNELQDPYPRD